MKLSTETFMIALLLNILTKVSDPGWFADFTQIIFVMTYTIALIFMILDLVKWFYEGKRR